MITTKNYFQEIETIEVSKLPETLRKSHEFVLKSTANGSTWETYDTNSIVHKVINLYLEKLNQHLASKSKSKSKDQPETLKSKAEKVKATSNSKSKTRSEPSTEKPSSKPSVFQKAYTLLKDFIPGFGPGMKEKNQVILQIKDEKREVHFIGQHAGGVDLLVLDYVKNKQQLQYDVIVDFDKKQADVTSYVMQNEYELDYGLSKKDKREERDGGDIGESLTKSMVKYLKDIASLEHKTVVTKENLKKGSEQLPNKEQSPYQKKVEHISEEIKFIKRFVSLHNKTKPPNAILAFIKALQRSIVQRLIRKSSPLATEIQMIQDKLIHAYSKMKGEIAFEINEKDLSRLVGIAGGEQVYPSITVIKRFIGLQEKSDEDKIHSFLKYMENLAKNKRLTKDDPYADKVNEIYKRIRQRTSAKIVISEVELNGLEGILKGCSCTNNLGGIEDKIPSTGSTGILTAEEMANRKLDLLNFISFWLTLFGRPAKNFTMMFHGEPHHGKTILLLKLAQYLAENFGSVLYVSSEEFASTTMTDKVNDFLNPLPKQLHFAESLQDVDLSKYEFVILDSVNDLGLNINQYKEIRKENPDIAFILILQHTKAGDFRGGKDWEHKAEIVGEVNKGVVTLSKNRFGSKNSLDFFRQFGLQWQEPTNEPSLKPYPISGDMVTSKNDHY